MRSGESYIQTLRDASVGAGDGRWSSVADDKNLFTSDAEWNAICRLICLIPLNRPLSCESVTT